MKSVTATVRGVLVTKVTDILNFLYIILKEKNTTALYKRIYINIYICNLFRKNIPVNPVISILYEGLHILFLVRRDNDVNLHI